MIFRSLLFVPGDRPERMPKADAAGADAIILDLEDSVADGAKAAARDAVRAHLLGARAAGAPALLVRINPLGSPHALADLAAIVPAAPAAVVLPKAEGAADIVRLGHYLAALETAAGLPEGRIRILPIATETPRALFTLDSYREAPDRLLGLTWGAEDLPAAIGAAGGRNEDGSYTDICRLARSLCIAAAASAGIPAYDTVFPAFRDLPGLTATAARGRRDGFAGMLAIHPTQVAAINGAFTPGENEIAEARAIVALFERNPGVGALAHEGRMVDRPHLLRAQRIVSQGTPTKR